MKPDLPETHWRSQLYTVIFGHETKWGKRFDEYLIATILLSVLTVILASVPSLSTRFGAHFYAIEWCFTIIFTVEYGLRLTCHSQPLRYARSFFGVIDILAVIPTYLDLFLPGTHVLVVIRIFRVLRVFRILRLIQFIGEANQLINALRSSFKKITVFLMFIMSLVVLLGSIMYLVEGSDNGFTSIPVGIYWAIVTMTTVGYGDISPATPLGRAFAALVMVLGYAIIAVPTGIVTVELGKAGKEELVICPNCPDRNHQKTATFCKSCGSALIQG